MFLNGWECLHYTVRFLKRRPVGQNFWGLERSATLARASPWKSPQKRVVSGWQRRFQGVWNHEGAFRTVGRCQQNDSNPKPRGPVISEDVSEDVMSFLWLLIRNPGIWNFLEIMKPKYGANQNIAENFTENLELSVKHQQEIRIAFLPDASSSILCASISRKKTTPAQLIKAVISTLFSARFSSVKV